MPRPTRVDVLTDWQVGDDITAERLQDFTDAINQNTAAVRAPQQVEDSSQSRNKVFNEVARATSEVQVFDQNQANYATISRIESIQLQDGDGNLMTLIFSN